MKKEKVQSLQLEVMPFLMEEYYKYNRD